MAVSRESATTVDAGGAHRNPPRDDLRRTINFARDRLQRDPTDARAIRLLVDIIVAENGDVPSAHTFSEVVGGEALNPESYFGLGIALGEANILASAIWAFQQATNAKPGWADAWYNLGESHRRAGDIEAAADAFGRATAADPAHSEAWYSLGNVLVSGDALDAALAAYDNAITLHDQAAVVHNNCGVVLRRLGRSAAAAASFRRAIEIQRDYSTAFDNLGNAMMDLGDRNAAITAFRAAIEIEPAYYDAHYNLGNALREQRQLTEAVACYHRALEFRPEHDDARTHLGLALQELGELEAAADVFERLIMRDPDDGQAHGNLANVRRDQGRYDVALEHFRRALAMTPGDPHILGNKALALHHQGHCAEAISCYRTALADAPDDIVLHNNLAQVLLLAGEFEEGWREFEWRLRDPELSGIVTGLPGREWRGENLREKSILVRAEQGFGDTIQFARCLAILAAKGARVSLACPAKLVRLLRSLPAVDRLVPTDMPYPASDYWAPLLSLPRLLGIGMANIPDQTPYLFAEPELIEHWGSRLAGVGKLRVGLAWQGNPAYAGDRVRSVPLSALAPLIQRPGVEFYSLQKGAGRNQLDPLSRSADIVDLAAELDETDAFVDTAAVMANLDLILTSDTAIPHLAAALGRPVWMMTTFAPDWRWRLERNDSPWYPTMRLFRQTVPGNWDGVAARLDAALSFWQQSKTDALTAYDEFCGDG